MHGHGDVGGEHALAESAEYPSFPRPAGRFNDLERRVIGVRRENERALRYAGGDPRMDLPERVGLRRDSATLEFGADRVEDRPLVVRGSGSQRDTPKDREDLVGIE